MTPLTRVKSTIDEHRTCYRCGNPERFPHTFRFLPGSLYVLVCPACYQLLWGRTPKRKGQP